MSEDWLSAESFERANDLISAVNTLSIHTKLGGVEPALEKLVAGARQKLAGFIDRLAVTAGQVESNSQAPLPGADPRWGLLARSFASARQSRLLGDDFAAMSAADIKTLLFSTDPADRLLRLDCLRMLRRLLEENVAQDTVGILGDL